MSSRPSRTPKIDALLNLSPNSPMPLAALLGLKLSPRTPGKLHRAERAVQDYCNFCGSAESAFPIRPELFGNFLEERAKQGVPYSNLRWNAHILIAVHTYWALEHPGSCGERLSPSLSLEIFEQLSAYKRKSVYDYLEIDLFDAHQTWGERALEARRSVTALFQEMIK